MKSRAIATLIVASFFLTGCAAGGNAPTRLIKQVTDGVEKERESQQMPKLRLQLLV